MAEVPKPQQATGRKRAFETNQSGASTRQQRRSGMYNARRDRQEQMASQSREGERGRNDANLWDGWIPARRPRGETQNRGNFGNLHDRDKRPYKLEDLPCDNLRAIVKHTEPRWYLSQFLRPSLCCSVVRNTRDQVQRCSQCRLLSPRLQLEVLPGNIQGRGDRSDQ